MENFSEFDQQGSVPQRETGSIISHAFEMYKGFLGYAVLAMVIYVIASSVLQSFAGFDSQSFAEEIRSSGGSFNTQDVINAEGFKTYYGLSGLLGILLSPLFVGLIYMANKVNNKVPINFGDLFIGYKQNFVNILFYSLISNIIIIISFMLCFLPGLFVAPLLLIGYPVLLFENATAMDALKKTFNIAKENYGVFLGAGLLGALISVAGIMLCFVGVILTAPFIYAVMYSTYVAYAGKPRQITYNT